MNYLSKTKDPQRRQIKGWLVVMLELRGRKLGVDLSTP